jgi:hypothetical protein
MSCALSRVARAMYTSGRSPTSRGSAWLYAASSSRLRSRYSSLHTRGPHVRRGVGSHGVSLATRWAGLLERHAAREAPLLLLIARDAGPARINSLLSGHDKRRSAAAPLKCSGRRR